MNIYKADVKELSDADLLIRLKKAEAKGRSSWFSNWTVYPDDYHVCFRERNRRKELASIDHKIAIEEKRAKYHALKKRVGEDETIAIGLGQQPEYVSAHLINNGAG